jgi:WD40 repeat protein
MLQSVLITQALWCLGCTGSSTNDHSANGAVADDQSVKFRVNTEQSNVVLLQPIGDPLIAACVQEIAVSPDGKSLAVAELNKTEVNEQGELYQIVRLWDISSRTTFADCVHPNFVGSLAFTPNGKTVVTACADGIARLWDAATGEQIGELSHDYPAMDDVCFSSDGSFFLTISGKAHLWDFTSRQRRGNPFEQAAKIRQAVFNPKDNTFATGAEDGLVQFWDAATGEPTGEPLPHSGEITEMVFSADGEILFVASTINVDIAPFRLWKVATRQPLGDPIEHGISINSAAFSPDGHLLITGSIVMEEYNKLAGYADARLWDVATGKCLASLPFDEHAKAVVAFSPDGKSVVVACKAYIRLWDVSQFVRN